MYTSQSEIIVDNNNREAKMYGWPEAELVERAPSAASRVATTVAKSGIDYGESDSLKTVMI